MQPTTSDPIKQLKTGHSCHTADVTYTDHLVLVTELLDTCIMDYLMTHLCTQEEVAAISEHRPKATPLKPTIYGLGVEQRVQALRTRNLSPARRSVPSVLPSGVAECTFQPHTNLGRYLRQQHKQKGHGGKRGGACNEDDLDLTQFEDLIPG